LFNSPAAVATRWLSRFRASRRLRRLRRGLGFRAFARKRRSAAKTLIFPRFTHLTKNISQKRLLSFLTCDMLDRLTDTRRTAITYFPPLVTPLDTVSTVKTKVIKHGPPDAFYAIILPRRSQIDLPQKSIRRVKFCDLRYYSTVSRGLLRGRINGISRYASYFWSKRCLSYIYTSRCLCVCIKKKGPFLHPSVKKSFYLRRLVFLATTELVYQSLTEHRKII
jgi:hypothetical protein